MTNMPLSSTGNIFYMKLFGSMIIVRNCCEQRLFPMANKDYRIRQEQIARFAKAMGHPARIAILQFLARQQNCYFGDIHEELPIAKATVSQHLKELKDAGLIQGEVESPKVKYCINRDNWQLAFELFNGFLSQPLCKTEGCCGDNKQ